VSADGGVAIASFVMGADPSTTTPHPSASTPLQQNPIAKQFHYHLHTYNNSNIRIALILNLHKQKNKVRTYEILKSASI
jgi:hypothetical protein